MRGPKRTRVLVPRVVSRRRHALRVFPVAEHGLGCADHSPNRCRGRWGMLVDVLLDSYRWGR